VRKIPTVFVRDEADRRFVTPVVTPGCEWVFSDPLAAPTRKYDGTCVMLDQDGRWWGRREVKPGKETPVGFVAVQTDSVTGKTVGWEPIEQSAFGRWHAEASRGTTLLTPGTYELIGPKVNGNPEGTSAHLLVRHEDAERLPGAPVTFAALAAYLAEHSYEGIVWHHPDGRMAKLKKRDFPAKEAFETTSPETTELYRAGKRTWWGCWPARCWTWPPSPRSRRSGRTKAAPARPLTPGRRSAPSAASGSRGGRERGFRAQVQILASGKTPANIDFTRLFEEERPC
jgi:hypothetical protein